MSIRGCGFPECDCVGLRARYLDGDRDAFSQLIKNVTCLVHDRVKKILKFESEEIREEVVQEIYLKVSRKIGAWADWSQHGPGEICPWVKVVSDRCCIDEIRRKKRRIRTEPLPAEGGDDPDLSISPETILTFNEAIDQLPSNLREVVLLKAQGLSAAEIAQRIGRTVRAIEVRLARAYEILRGLL